VYSTRKILVLDAMGVIYAEGDDGQNLLYPFIVERGGSTDVRELIRVYNDASMGKISAKEFWQQLGLNPALEDEYLDRHRLSDGLPEFLKATAECKMELWCLSNDISEWSIKLRRKFNLEQYFKGFVISGDTGTRKPDPAIFITLLRKLKREPGDLIFLDDRLRNIEAAYALGIQGILFNPAPEDSQGHTFPIVRNFSELLAFLKT
jgi:HAD superfamily hydrolase (TIGR01509 family)